MNAFEVLKPKAETIETESAHTVTVNSTTVENDELVIRVPLASIGQSKRANSKYGKGHPKEGQLKPESERAIGFVWPSIPFEVNGASFRIKPGWTSLTAGK